MTSGIDSQELNRPLSVGDIVSISLRLYTQNFKPYFFQALRASLWQFLLLVGIIPLAVGAGLENVGIMALSIPIAIAAYVYGIAKVVAGQYVISRLAFQTLRGQSEPMADARRYCNARTWRFFIAGLLWFLIAFVGFIVVALPFVLIAAVMGAIANSGGSAEPNGLVIGGMVLLLFLLGLGVIVLACWLSGRTSVLLMPIVDNPETLSAQSLGRGWNLTQGHGWRIFLVLLLLGLLMIPVAFAVQIISFFIQLPLAFMAVAATQSSQELGFLVQGISQLISFSVGIFVGSLLTPLSQSIISVIYFDLLNRKEGTGLSLRDSAGEGM
jgi:hypothetical protein